MVKENYQKSMGAWIPAFILSDKDLTPTDKIIYAMVQNLSNERGYCWASNEYFAKETGISVATITRCVNNLKAKNLIVDFYEVNDKGRFRRLKIDHPITAPEIEGGLLNLRRGVSSECGGGSPQFEEHNKKNINKRKEYIVNIATQVLTTYDLLYKKYFNSNARNSTVTDQRISIISARINQFEKHYAGHDFLKAVDFTFGYKANEWKDDPVMKSYFELETLLRPSNFIKYVEQALKNKGVPPTKSTKPEDQKIVAKSPFKKEDHGEATI